MSDLEFIERLIEDKKLLCKNELFYREEHHKGLQHLQQIKAKLEAWEVVKEELQIVLKSKNFYNEPLQSYELTVIGQDKINILNKALEVKDE